MNSQHATDLYFNKVPLHAAVDFFSLTEEHICRRCNYLCLDLWIRYMVAKGFFFSLPFQSLVYTVTRLTLKRLINPTEKNQHMYEAISRTLELRDTKDI